MNKKFLVFKLWCIFGGLALGNFIFQYFTHQDWNVCAERTWFQGVAIFAVWFNSLYDGWVTSVLEEGFDKNLDR